LFAGAPLGGAGSGFDAGAVRIINNTGASVMIQGLVVDSFENGASFSLWGGFLGAGFKLDPGKSAIFTQTIGENFDTSDQPQHDLPASNAMPQVHFTIDGVMHNFTDTAQVLNTGGSDHLALNNLNESFQWRDIGTFGGQAAPEPASLTMLAIGIAGMAGYRLRKRKMKVA
jgi:hypothetical protein